MEWNSIPEFYIVLVEPKYGGNIGAVARSMANFNFKNLYLINPCELDGDCFARAMHAQDILNEAKIFHSFDEAIKNLDFLVALHPFKVYRLSCNCCAFYKHENF